MKKTLMKVLAMVMVLCMLLPVGTMAAATTYIRVTISENPGTYVVTDESSHYLTEDTNLLAEVVAIINENYKINRKMFGFGSPAMQDIMDEGLDAYAESDAAWQRYLDTYYADVENASGQGLKAILQDKSSVLGDLQANVEYKIYFENTVAGDAKYGTVYTVTIVRVGGKTPTGTDAELNKGDHFAYVTGYPDGTFGPNKHITREETTVIFYRLLTEASREKYATDVCAFSDVKPSWSYEAIATMSNAGLIKGDNGKFRPGDKITRAEFATIAARFLSDPYTGETLFPDAVGHWAEDAINRAAAAGWIKGDNGKFRPNDKITRAEAVTLINRMLERQPENVDDLLDGMTTFTDNMDTNKWYYLAIQEAANGHGYTRKADGVFESWTALK
jgi:hypothetical protein